MKKLLLIAIALLGSAMAQVYIPLGLSKTELYEAYTKEEIKVIESTKDIFYVIDNKSIRHLYTFQNNIVAKYCTIFNLSDINPQAVPKFLDEKLYRLDKDLMVWFETESPKKSKYMISYVLDYETDTAIIIYNINPK